MKKILVVFILIYIYSHLLFSQNNHLVFFPNTEGAMMIHRTFSSDDQLVASIVYRIKQSYEYDTKKNIEIGYTALDNLNNIIDRGDLDALYFEGDLFLQMPNRVMSSDIIETLGSNTMLVGNYMDYPDGFDSPFDGNFEMPVGEYTIRSKNGKRENLRVRIYDRKHEGKEEITTPAGTFDACKITFKFDCIKNNRINTHTGVEWYAKGAGIVRSETYNEDGELENYTVLTTLEDMYTEQTLEQEG